MNWGRVIVLVLELLAKWLERSGEKKKEKAERLLEYEEDQKRRAAYAKRALELGDVRNAMLFIRGHKRMPNPAESSRYDLGNGQDRSDAGGEWSDNNQSG